MNIVVLLLIHFVFEKPVPWWIYVVALLLNFTKNSYEERRVMNVRVFK